MGTRGWFTSSFSNGSGTCVEVRFRDERVHVRDSKDRCGPVVTVGAREWVSFLDGSTDAPVRVDIDQGEWCLSVAGQRPVLRFSEAEWRAFTQGVTAREFDPPGADTTQRGDRTRTAPAVTSGC